VLDSDGVTALVGEDRFHDNVPQAILAEHRAQRHEIELEDTSDHHQ
jgi:hypothetical protein